MANVFANQANLLLTALFFHPLLPISIPIAFFGTIFSYWTNKYLLLRRVRRPEEISSLLTMFFVDLLPWMALIWALSVSLFYR
jgi:branched-subunit amino acid ABC-type transport system permease component